MRSALTASVSVLVLSLPFVGSPAQAQAQSQGTGDTEQVARATGVPSGTIIVTARKREESLLETPIAVTAFDEEAIEALGLENIRDLPAVTPGFIFEPFQGIPGRFDSSPQFRGIGINSIAPTRQTASIFVDGIYVANGALGLNLSDVARVEVIKGPQSALFGRNTFGGAVNYISKVPGTEPGGEFSARLATRDEYSASLALEAPIIGDALRARVSGFWSDEGGHYENNLDGSKLGRERTWSVTGTLYAEPSPDFDATLRINYFENDDDAPAYSFVGKNFHNCGPFGGTDRTVCGDVPTPQPGLNTNLSDAVMDFYQGLFQLNDNPLDGLGLERRSLRISAAFNTRLPQSDIELSWLTGLNYDEVDLLRDADDSSDNAFLSYSGRQFRDISQEIRISSTFLDDRVSWSFGGNYFDQRFTNNGEFIVPPIPPASRITSFGAGEPAEENIETFGVFASVIADVTDWLSITAEGRYQVDQVAEDDDITDNRASERGKFRSFLPRFIIDVQPTPDTLIYASYSEGNLPGGFNTNVRGLTPAQRAELAILEPAADETFDEENLKSYEIGLKHAFGLRGSLAVAAFYMDRIGQAVRRVDRVASTTSASGTQQVNYFLNIGQTEIKGVEAQGNYEIFPGLTLGGTVAYVDAIVKDFETSVYNEVFGTPDASGTRTPRFPEWSGSAFVAAEGELSATLGWFGRADAFYTGQRFADEVNLTTIEEGWQINLRAGLNTEGLRFEAFVTNLTEADHPTGINRFRDLTFATPQFDFSTFGYQIGLRDKRQVGVRVSGDF